MNIVDSVEVILGASSRWQQLAAGIVNVNTAVIQFPPLYVFVFISAAVTARGGSRATPGSTWADPGSTAATIGQRR